MFSQGNETLINHCSLTFAQQEYNRK